MLTMTSYRERHFWHPYFARQWRQREAARGASQGLWDSSTF
jgi:hypothetical protein